MRMLFFMLFWTFLNL